MIREQEISVSLLEGIREDKGSGILQEGSMRKDQLLIHVKHRLFYLFLRDKNNIITHLCSSEAQFHVTGSNIPTYKLFQIFN